MLISLYELKFVKFVGLLFVIFLVACTTNQRYKEEFSADESYLNTPILKKLTIPKDISLPLKNEEYDIPAANQNGVIGKALDIRPPI